VRTSSADITLVIQCDITAKPTVVNMFWIIDDNGTTIGDASGLADIWTSSAVSYTSPRITPALSDVYICIQRPLIMC